MNGQVLFSSNGPSACPLRSPRSSATPWVFVPRTAGELAIEEEGTLDKGEAADGATVATRAGAEGLCVGGGVVCACIGSAKGLFFFKITDIYILLYISRFEIRLQRVTFCR